MVLIRNIRTDHWNHKTRMALKGAQAFACIARERSPFLSSTTRYVNLGFHNSHLHSLKRFTSYPNHQSGITNQIRATREAAVDTLTPNKEKETKPSPEPENWKIKMLYDGECPLCMREVNMLKERNQQYGTIKFVDIGSNEYSPEENQGLDYKTVMGRIHAILSDGTVVTDVEAFRRLYEQVGLGWVYAITKYEPIATLADAVYGVWAKYRLQITGRPPLEEILEARMKNKGQTCRDGDACKM